MSISFTVRSGRPCVEIVDHKAEVWAYRYEVVTHSDRMLAVRLTKLEDPDEKAYLVKVGKGWSSCDCMDYQCRKRKVGDVCKHLRLIKDPDFKVLLGLVPAAATAQLPAKEASRA